MSNAQRVWKVLKGLFTVACSVLMILSPDYGYIAVVLIIDVSLLLLGIRLLIYYFTLARYSVGGMMTLYKSIILLDFGFFVFSLKSTPQKYVMLYLIIGLAFAGAVDILDAMGARKLEASWKYHFSYGLGKIIIAVVCLFFLDSVQIVTYVFCAGLVYSAISDIIGACRKTAIVYIE